MKNVGIYDDSGDKKYFTIIPNYILNHSTLWDREVYIQMKRITGEDGTCWTSRNTLAKQCGISLDRLKKSIKYLVEHHWIEKIGTRNVMTRGGPQEVNEYRVVDLWDKNNTFFQEKYKGGSSETTPLKEGGSSNSQRGVVEDLKGGSSESRKEEPLIIRTNKQELEAKTPKETNLGFFNKGEEYSNWMTFVETHPSKTSLLSETNKFITYWTEPNSTGTKLRWQLENTFEVKRRLATWLSRAKVNYKQESKYKADAI